MKILHLIDSAGMYGAEKVLLSLAAANLPEGVSFVVGSLGRVVDHEKPLEKECKNLGIDLVVFRSGKFPLVKLAGSIISFIKKNDVDIIHSHGYKPTILLGFLSRRLRGARMVATVHGFTGGELKMLVYQLLDSLARRFLDGVVFVGKSMLNNRSINFFPNSNTTVITNGIAKLGEQSKISGELKKRIIEFRGDSILLISVGRLSKEKNTSILVDVQKYLRDRQENTKLLIIGEGDQRNNIEQKVRMLHLTESVFLIGYQASIPDLLEFADVYLMPSLTEGSPISILEAMRAGLPIVATRVGDLPFILSHETNATLVIKNHCEEFAQSVLNLCRDSNLRRSYGENSRARFLESYTDGRMIDNYVAFYRAVLNAD